MITRTSADDQRRRANAREAAARASTERHNRQPPEIDWDAIIARTKAMIDDIENRHKKKHD